MGILLWMVAQIATPAPAQNAPTSLICAVYDRADGALNAFEELRSLDRESMDSVRAYALISKDAFGRVRTQRIHAGASTLPASVVDRLAGLTPRSTVAMPSEALGEIEEALRPDSSALVIVLEADWAIDLARSMYHTNANARRVLRARLEARHQPDADGDQRGPAEQ
jgi:hypothetical protein